MIAAVIDIGSNTMRMSVYKIEGQKFTVLLSKKETAGLVNYITEGEMSEEGIGVLIDVLQQFCSSLEEISVNSINAFATASLRNVANSEQVLARVFHAVGLKVELLSGEEEAILSFSGAVHASPFADGCLFDLGGGSTEVVAFRERKPYYAKSMNIGCLNLYKRYVKKIWPKKLEIEEMKLFIERNLAEAALPEHPQPLLIGVGGTARSLLELYNRGKRRDGFPLGKLQWRNCIHAFLSAEKGYQCQGCGAEEMSGSDSYDYTGGVADAGLGEKNEGRTVIH